MKENCILCQIIEDNIPSKKIYEDEEVLAVLDVNGASPGHCFVLPKQHFPILEQVPDKIVAKLFSIANKISVAIFETLSVQGTNIFVTNGISAGQRIAHFMINVVPRQENDGIKLDWQPKQLDEEEISTVELKLKEQTDNVGIESSSESTTIKAEKSETLSDDDEEDYMLKQLKRIP
jgi:histidine triad (HIT) family protein